MEIEKIKQLKYGDKILVQFKDGQDILTVKFITLINSTEDKLIIGYDNDGRSDTPDIQTTISYSQVKGMAGNVAKEVKANVRDMFNNLVDFVDSVLPR